MSTALDAILDAQETAQQLSLDDLLTTLEQEESGSLCEFERECYEAQGVKAWEERRGELVQVYRCGWQSTDITWCPKHRRLLATTERG